MKKILNFLCNLLKLDRLHIYDENKGSHRNYLYYKRFIYYLNSEYSKSVRLEVCSRPSFRWSLSMDGDENEVLLTFWFGFTFYLSFDRLLPDKWFPKEWNSYANNGKGGFLHTAQREISLSIHNYSIWITLWEPNNEWHKGQRKWNWNYKEFIIGKWNFSKKEISREQFVLPYYEGNYNVEAIEEQRSWIMRRRLFFFLDITETCYQVQAGYYDNSDKWINKPIPQEGKGENSWDCDEDATYSISFGAKSKLRSKSEAALAFWQSTMRDRMRRGGKNWLPEKFQDKQIEVLI